MSKNITEIILWKSLSQHTNCSCEYTEQYLNSLDEAWPESDHIKVKRFIMDADSLRPDVSI